MTFDLVLIGLACSLEPIPLTGFILTLSTEHGTRKGLFFLAGWVASLAAVILITLAFTSGKPPAPNTEPSVGVLAAKIALGVALIVFAWRYRIRTSNAPKERSQPKWMKRVDHMSVWTAAVLAFLLQPWGLVAAGALSITQADTSKASNVLAIVLFAFLATLSLLVMEAYAILAPDAAQARLAGLRQWMDVHRSQVIVYLSVIVGLWLIGKSTYYLVH
ncbi:MAG: GAP family protein [Acidimicrobiales bacterium]